jgi:hypothetical protein
VAGATISPIIEKHSRRSRKLTQIPTLRIGNIHERRAASLRGKGPLMIRAKIALAMGLALEACTRSATRVARVGGGVGAIAPARTGLFKGARSAVERDTKVERDVDATSWNRGNEPHGKPGPTSAADPPARPNTYASQCFSSRRG